jgi:parallel beta-helix repeat protein
VIDGNFSLTASQHQWDGNGSIIDPYIISGYEFDPQDNSYLISILNTADHFVITDNNFTGGKGIYLSNVQFGRIQNNTISQSSNDGIKLLNSNNNSIFNNSITYNIGNGIYLTNSRYNSIEMNRIFYNTESGILLDYQSGGSNDNVITKNEVYWNSIDGIALDSNVWRNLVNYNQIFENGYDGIYLNSFDATIANNEISNNGQYGLHRSGGGQHVVENNTLIDNAYYFWSGGTTLPNIRSDIVFASFSNNTINGKPMYYFQNVHDFQVPEDAGYVLLVETSNVTVSNLNLDHLGAAITIFDSTNLTIAHNSIQYSSIDPLTIYGLSDSRIEYNDIGYSLGNSMDGTMVTDVNITHNKFHHSYVYGIYLTTSSNNNYIFENDIYNNSLSDNYGGILISGGGHKIINNSIFDNNHLGIYMYKTTTTLVSGNHIYGNLDDGIYLSSYVTVSANTFERNLIENNGGGGLLIGSGHENIIKNNIIVQNKGNGIWIINAIENEAFGNILAFNSVNLYLSSYTTYSNITNNIIYGSTSDGIYLANDVELNIIQNNTITLSYDYGINIGWSAGANNITQNNFFDNNKNTYFAESQAYDRENLSYFADNYWNDWTTPDSGGDGIVDLPYQIDNSNQDLTPSTSPLHPDHHHLTFPTFTAPASGIEYTLLLDISWLHTISYWAFPVTYSLYYSVDDGQSWVLIAEDIIETEYTWDTTEVSNGNYLLKVVAEDSIGGSNVSILENQILVNNDPHQLSAPQFIAPTTQILQGAVGIEWSQSVDNWLKPVNYTLYYSNDGGTEWTILLDSSTSTTYIWDTTDLDNGNYLLKIVASAGDLTSTTIGDKFSIMNAISTTETSTSLTSETSTTDSSISPQPSTSDSTGSSSQSTKEPATSFEISFLLPNVLVIPLIRRKIKKTK